MAEIHINSAEQFIECLSQDLRNDTIILETDIDLQNLTFPTFKNMFFNIDGKGHAIYNVQTSTEAFRFLNEGTLIKNVRFANCLQLSNESFFARHTTSPTGFIEFENCQFQGKFGFLSTRGFYFRKCFFDLDKIQQNYIAYSGSNLATDTNYTFFEDCYFNINSMSVSNGNLCADSRVINCYFKGNINVNQSCGISIFFRKSVFNFYTTGTGTLNMGASTGENISVYNSDRIHNAINGVPCTDSEMKNAQALFNKGFDIIVT